MQENGKQLDEIRHPRQRKFLKAYAKIPMVSRAAKIAGIDRTTHYVWMKDESKAGEAYRRVFENLRTNLCGALEDEAFRRAVVGTKKPVFSQGIVCGHVREFSDMLLKLLLQANMPTKFSDRQRVEHTGRKEAPIHIVAEMLSDDELAAIAAPGSLRIAETPSGKNGSA